MFLLLLAFIFASIALYQLLALVLSLLGWGSSTASASSDLVTVVFLSVENKDR
ncbi:MAG: hypothetical protein ACOYB0_01535 [Polynucleobacter sp.]